MIRIEYNNEEYIMPTNMGEVSIDKYIEITSISKDTIETDRLLMILSILTGISVGDIKDIPMDKISLLMNHMQFLFKTKEYLLQNQIEIDGVLYGFNKDLHKLPFGEYIDLQEFNKGSSNENLHIIMALLYKPIKRKSKTKLITFLKSVLKKDDLGDDYELIDNEDVIERSKIFRYKMKVDVSLGALFFFIIFSMLLVENSKQSLTKKEMMIWTIRKMKTMGVVFSTNGDG